MKKINFKERLFNQTIERVKTQTRRLINPQPDIMYNCCMGRPNPIDKGYIYLGKVEGVDTRIKPRYKVGETVFLTEPYCQEAEPYNPIEGLHGFRATGKYLYKFSGDSLSENDPLSPFGKWKNKLFMPEEAARYFIKITGVRAERLQDISDEDCIKEGVFKHISHNKIYWKNGFDGLMYEEPRHAYAALINLINGKDTWNNNPFVWVYDYELTTIPKDNE